MWPLKGGYPVPKKGGQAAVHTTVQQQSRQRPGVWTGHQILGEQGYLLQSIRRVRLRRQMPIPNCTHSTAEQSTKTPSNPHARTCACKAVDLQFLLIKAFTQKDYLSTLTAQGKRNLDYELRHRFNTSVHMLSVTGTPYRMQHTLHKCFSSSHQHFSVSLIPPTFTCLTPKQQTIKKEVTSLQSAIGINLLKLDYL